VSFLDQGRSGADAIAPDNQARHFPECLQKLPLVSVFTQQSIENNY